ncbi:hypothetical protein CVT24_001665 [Panaeolus cyanescens]|uniref:F-box domain-containing protein n=1 Tax=Panaeolus cyanescens TaxID=181874 RepID=A0A409VT82_9AGAR|nr:hypothetical protein CVT24_001665 [Panaeolus cyanescens]
MAFRSIFVALGICAPLAFAGSAALTPRQSLSIPSSCIVTCAPVTGIIFTPQDCDLIPEMCCPSHDMLQLVSCYHCFSSDAAAITGKHPDNTRNQGIVDHIVNSCHAQGFRIDLTMAQITLPGQNLHRPGVHAIPIPTTTSTYHVPPKPHPTFTSYPVHHTSTPAFIPSTGFSSPPPPPATTFISSQTNLNNNTGAALRKEARVISVSFLLISGIILSVLTSVQCVLAPVPPTSPRGSGQQETRLKGTVRQSTRYSSELTLWLQPSFSGKPILIIEEYRGQAVSKNLTTITLPTTLVDLLSHNDPLTNLQSSCVSNFEDTISQNFLLNAEQKDKVVQQIQRLQEELSALAVSRERLERQSFICKLVRSPFRRLPEDIIYHIIKQCPQNYPEDALVFSPRTHIPTLLAQVSSIWRASVFRQSSLWRKISINSSHWKAKPLEVERRLDLFTTLSVPGGGISLNLLSRYDDNDDDDVQQEADLHSALDWILHTWPHSHSINQLNLRLVSPAAVVKFLQNARPGKCSFQTLQFIIPDYYSDVSDETVTWIALTSMLQCLPHVQHFSISYCEAWRFSDITSWINGAQASSNPWSQLTTLYLDDGLMNVLEWYALLKACSRLVRARICVYAADSGVNGTYHPLPGTRVTHNFLESLFIQLCEPSDVPSNSPESVCSVIFIGTSFPKLKVLRAYWEDDYDEGDASHQSLNCLQGVFPVLEELHLRKPYFIPLTWAGFFPLILAVPTVTTFSIALNFDLLSEFVGFLQANHGPFPRLAHLSLVFQDPVYLSKIEEKKRAICELMLDIRRWYSRVTMNRGNGLDSDVESSMKIQFFWHEGQEKRSLFDTREFSKSLQELCGQEQGVPIVVECAGDQPTRYEVLFGGDLFRELYFS